MTTQVIISSVLHAVQQIVSLRRVHADPMELAAINWADEAKAIISRIPSDPALKLADWLVLQKQYSSEDVTAAGAAISLMEHGPDLFEALSEIGSLSKFATASPDQEITDYIVTTVMGKQANTQAAPQSSPTPTQAPSITIDPGMENAINALLGQATGGKITNVKSIITQNDELRQELVTARTDAANAVNRARAQQIPTSGSTATSQGDLTFEVVYQKAMDIFIFNGVKSKSLAFDVPTLVWKDPAGNVVQHPEVPAIDPHYDFDAMKVLQFLIALNRNMNPWLFGHTGTGKSTFVEQIAAHIGWPVSRINLDANLERADLVGHITLTEQNGTTISKYEEGILPRSMQRPGFLLIDEIDAGRPDILFVIQRALESKGLMLTEDKGRIVQPHPLFRFAATANTRGQGDEYGMYAGTRTMNASMLDRFTAFIEFTYMKPDRESNLLQSLVPSLPKDMADKMALLAKEIRSAFGKGEVYTTVSPRGLSVLADSFATFTSLGTKDDAAFNLAFNMALLNKATTDTRQKFIEIASRVFNFQINKTSP